MYIMTDYTVNPMLIPAVSYTAADYENPSLASFNKLADWLEASGFQ